jgi:hypothetical protein
MIDPASAAPRLATLGFLASGSRTDLARPGYLLVALREEPARTHFDPEHIEYWASEAGRGSRRIIDHDTRLPLTGDVSWGPIRVSDRLGESNEYVGFGGRLSVARIDKAVIAAFTSPAPLLVAGGHSQTGDQLAPMVGAFFGRLLLAIDYVAGLEAVLAGLDPLARYSAFVANQGARYRSSPRLRDEEADLVRLIDREALRLRVDHGPAWSAGEAVSLAVGRLVAGNGQAGHPLAP